MATGMLQREMTAARLRVQNPAYRPSFFIYNGCLQRIYMDIYSAVRKAPVGDYSALDLVKSLHSYFQLPMTTYDKIVAGVVVAVLLLLIIYIIYRTILLIWKGEERKKLL